MYDVTFRSYTALRAAVKVILEFFTKAAKVGIEFRVVLKQWSEIAARR